MSTLSALGRKLSQSPKPSAKSMQILCEHLSPSRKLLGVDFGTRYLGLAISDGSQLVAQPFAVFDEKAASRVFSFGPDSLGEMISSNNIDALVVGLPFTSGDGEDEACARVRRFVHSLHSHGVTSVPAFLWDEKGSSQEVRRVLSDFHGVHVFGAQKRRGADKMAACLVLQRFLDYLNRGRAALAQRAMAAAVTQGGTAGGGGIGRGGTSADPGALHAALTMQMMAAASRPRAAQRSLSSLLPHDDPYVIVPPRTRPSLPTQPNAGTSSRR